MADAIRSFTMNGFTSAQGRLSCTNCGANADHVVSLRSAWKCGCGEQGASWAPSAPDDTPTALRADYRQPVDDGRYQLADSDRFRVPLDVMKPDASYLPRQAAIQAANRLAGITERWCRKAVEAGPGWRVWRSEPRVGEWPNHFVTTYEFRLIPPGVEAAGVGVIFSQPELTEGERARLPAGRHDWQEDRWEDHCGVAGCDHPCCRAYWGD